MSLTQGPAGPGLQQQPPPPLGMMPPAVQQKPTGVARSLAFARGLSGKAFVLAIVVLGLQAAMPEGRRPSDLIGGFHGSTESAELNAKREAQARYERDMAIARAAPPANYQMETQVSQTQQQAVAGSLEAQASMANLADVACLGSGLVTAFFGQDRDTQNVANALRNGCGVGDKLRDNITGTLARTARDGSGIVQRSTPEPVATTPFVPYRAPNGPLVPAAVPPR